MLRAVLLTCCVLCCALGWYGAMRRPARASNTAISQDGFVWGWGRGEVVLQSTAVLTF